MDKHMERWRFVNKNPGTQIHRQPSSPWFCRLHLGSVSLNTQGGWCIMKPPSLNAGGRPVPFSVIRGSWAPLPWTTAFPVVLLVGKGTAEDEKTSGMNGMSCNDEEGYHAGCSQRCDSSKRQEDLCHCAANPRGIVESPKPGSPHGGRPQIRDSHRQDHVRAAPGLVGIKEEDVEKIWKDLGMDMGKATELCVHYVQACPGTSVCRFGVQDSLGLGLEIEKLFVGMELPAKLKIGISGCPMTCGESFVRDLGILGKRTGGPSSSAAIPVQALGWATFSPKDSPPTRPWTSPAVAWTTTGTMPKRKSGLRHLWRGSGWKRSRRHFSRARYRVLCRHGSSPC